MFSFTKTEQTLQDLKKLLRGFYIQQVENEVDKYQIDDQILNEHLIRIEEFAKELKNDWTVQKKEETNALLLTSGFARVRVYARSQAVVDKLVENGIARDRLTATGKGQTAPIADNGTDWGSNNFKMTWCLWHTPTSCPVVSIQSGYVFLFDSGGYCKSNKL